MTPWRHALLSASDCLGAWPWKVRVGPARGLRVVVPLRRRPGYCLGWHEPHVVACLKRYLRPGGLVLDVGSHLGYFALVAARLVASTGRVYAFEPLPENAVRLARTLRRNQLSNVHLVARALGETSGRALLAAAGNDSMAQVSSEVATVDAEPGSVPLMRLDDWLEENRAVRQIDLIKIDVEGHELALLRGGAEALRRFSPRLVIELHWCRQVETSPVQVVTWLSDHGYRVRLLPRRRDDPRDLEQVLAAQSAVPPPARMVAFHVLAEAAH